MCARMIPLCLACTLVKLGDTVTAGISVTCKLVILPALLQKVMLSNSLCRVFDTDWGSVDMYDTIRH